MEKLIINNYEEFASYEGQILGTSDYVELTQERISTTSGFTLTQSVQRQRASLALPSLTAISHSLYFLISGSRLLT